MLGDVYAQDYSHFELISVDSLTSKSFFDKSGKVLGNFKYLAKDSLMLELKDHENIVVNKFGDVYLDKKNDFICIFNLCILNCSSSNIMFYNFKGDLLGEVYNQISIGNPGKYSFGNDGSLYLSQNQKVDNKLKRVIQKISKTGKIVWERVFPHFEIKNLIFDNSNLNLIVNAYDSRIEEKNKILILDRDGNIIKNHDYDHPYSKSKSINSDILLFEYDSNRFSIISIENTKVQINQYEIPFDHYKSLRVIDYFPKENQLFLIQHIKDDSQNIVSLNLNDSTYSIFPLEKLGFKNHLNFVISKIFVNEEKTAISLLLRNTNTLCKILIK